eukprot:6455223-Amphidinium_carterae.1
MFLSTMKRLWQNQRTRGRILWQSRLVHESLMLATGYWDNFTKTLLDLLCCHSCAFGWPSALDWSPVLDLCTVTSSPPLQRISLNIVHKFPAMLKTRMLVTKELTAACCPHICKFGSESLPWVCGNTSTA